MKVELDPQKTYAEMQPGTNLVARVFSGEPLIMYPGRVVVEVPKGVTVQVGYFYQPPATFSLVPPPPTIDERAAVEVDASRLLFEINYDQENRIRALEGKGQVSKATYRDELIARWKRLNQ